ncbi:MAG TPA: metal-dependent hydrolase [Aequorivita sp.]|nr:metal-dependent hydrolase [Aequorivita sp.]
MDSITQIVLGAAVGEAVLGKKIGNKAMALGALAGTIPDFDVAAGYFTDTVTALEIHRGFTHSIVFAVGVGLLFAWMLALWDKRASLKEWWWFWFLTFVTHPLLDAHTTWGTQLFWPFDLRLAYKNIFVIDPLYTLPFLFFLILAMFQKRGSAKRQKFNNLGLIVSSSYMVLTIILKGITFQKFQKALVDQEIDYISIQTKPSPFNTIMWTANIETEDSFLIGNYSFFDTQPIQFHSHPKNHEALGSLKEEDKIQRLIKVAEGWYTITERDGQMLFNDLRFGLMSVDPNTDKYAFSYILEKENDELKIIEEPKDRSDAKKLLADLWQRIGGN